MLTLFTLLHLHRNIFRLEYKLRHELQLNKANASDTKAAILDLNLSIHIDIDSTKIYDKRDDFNFDIVNFPFLRP